MLMVNRIDDFTRELVINFLKSIPSIENVDEDILKNVVVALDNEQVVGCISFEIYGNKGLIRYFVFKKKLNEEVLNKMIGELEKVGLDNAIELFVCVAENPQIGNLFKSLDFKTIHKEHIFIDEENVKNTIFKNSYFFSKYLIY